MPGLLCYALNVQTADLELGLVYCLTTSAGVLLTYLLTDLNPS
jgi:hypothetical protein